MIFMETYKNYAKQVEAARSIREAELPEISLEEKTEQVEAAWSERSEGLSQLNIEQEALLIAFGLGKYSGPMTDPFTGYTLRKLHFKNTHFEIIFHCEEDETSRKVESLFIYHRRPGSFLGIKRPVYQLISSSEENRTENIANLGSWRDALNALYKNAFYHLSTERAYFPESMKDITDCLSDSQYSPHMNADDSLYLN